MRVRLGVGWAIVVASLWATGARASEVRAIYPLHPDGASPAEVGEVQKLLQSVLHERRPKAAAVKLLEPTCGPSHRASLACLAKVEPRGLVLFGDVARARDRLVVLLGVVDARARKFGPARVELFPAFPDRQALLDAVTLLETQATPPSADDFRLQPSTGAAPLAAAAPPAGAWKRTAGPWLTVAGLVLLAGGAAVGLLDRQLDADLESRFAARALTPADADGYRRVATYNLAADGLFASGALVGAAGVWLWATAPVVAPVDGGGAIAGVRGTF